MYDRARVGPITKTSDEISIICLFWLILQANPLFCFELWYSSCFEVKCWFHTFPKWCSHTPMWIPILLDHQDCLVNPFHRCVFSSSGSDHFNIRKINSSPLNGVHFICPKLPLFSCPPTLFLRGLEFLNQVSFYSCEVSPFFSSMFLSSDSQEDTNGAPSSSLFILVFFSGGFTLSFRCWSYPYPCSNAIPCWCLS